MPFGIDKNLFKMVKYSYKIKGENYEKQQVKINYACCGGTVSCGGVLGADGLKNLLELCSDESPYGTVFKVITSHIGENIAFVSDGFINVSSSSGSTCGESPECKITNDLKS